MSDRDGQHPAANGSNPDAASVTVVPAPRILSVGPHPANVIEGKQPDGAREKVGIEIRQFKAELLDMKRLPLDGKTIAEVRLKNIETTERLRLRNIKCT